MTAIQLLEYIDELIKLARLELERIKNEN